MTAMPEDADGILRFGFDWEREWFIPYSMAQLKYLPFIGSLTLHPIVFYLLTNEQKSMLSEIRISYFFFYLSLVFDEWLFCFALRIYPLFPYAALYCEGPLCSINEQWIMALLSFSFLIGNCPLDFLIVRMHQIFVPSGSILKLSKRSLIIVNFFNVLLMVSNVIAFGIFGKDCDDTAELIEEPELAWLRERGGRILMFGPPTAPQHFSKALALLAVTLCIIAPVSSALTGDAMRRVWATKAKSISVGTQAMSRRMFQVLLFQLSLGGVNYVGPLIFFFSFMVFNVSWMPGSALSLLRFVNTIGFTTRIYVFGLFFTLKNPQYRKRLIRKAKRCVGKGSDETMVEVTTKIQ